MEPNNEDDGGGATPTSNPVPPITEGDPAIGSNPHNGAAATPHGKEPNGSALVTPRGRASRTNDADAGPPAEGAPPVFISAQLLLYKNQLELAQKTIASNRALLIKYGAIEDNDPEFIDQAFELDPDPGTTNNPTGIETDK